MQIGDTLRHRYRVLHTLGHVTFSTTWLARDARDLVPVKVCVAESNADEMVILLVLNDSRRPSPLIPTLLDHFEMQGPNKSILAMSLSRREPVCPGSKTPSVPCFSLMSLEPWLAQLVSAVSYMHSRAFVHGGMSHFRLAHPLRQRLSPRSPLGNCSFANATFHGRSIRRADLS